MSELQGPTSVGGTTFFFADLSHFYYAVPTYYYDQWILVLVPVTAYFPPAVVSENQTASYPLDFAPASPAPTPYSAHNDDRLQRANLRRAADEMSQSAFSPRGARNVQAAIQQGSAGFAQLLLRSFHSRIGEAATSPHANHVVQELVRALPNRAALFLSRALCKRIREVAFHPTGFRVLQRLLERREGDCRWTVLRACMNLRQHDELASFEEMVRHPNAAFVLATMAETARPDDPWPYGRLRLMKYLFAATVVPSVASYLLGDRSPSPQRTLCPCAGLAITELRGKGDMMWPIIRSQLLERELKHTQINRLDCATVEDAARLYPCGSSPLPSHKRPRGLPPV